MMRGEDDNSIVKDCGGLPLRQQTNPTHAATCVETDAGTAMAFDLCAGK